MSQLTVAMHPVGFVNPIQNPHDKAVTMGTESGDNLVWTELARTKRQAQLLSKALVHHTQAHICSLYIEPLRLHHSPPHYCQISQDRVPMLCQWIMSMSNYQHASSTLTLILYKRKVQNNPWDWQSTRSWYDPRASSVTLLWDQKFLIKEHYDHEGKVKCYTLPITSLPVSLWTVKSVSILCSFWNDHDTCKQMHSQIPTTSPQELPCVFGNGHTCIALYFCVLITHLIWPWPLDCQMMHEMLHPDLGPVVLSGSQSSNQGGTVWGCLGTAVQQN